MKIQYRKCIYRKNKILFNYNNNQTTLGVEFTTKNVKINNKIYYFHVWDTTGTRKIRNNKRKTEREFYFLWYIIVKQFVCNFFLFSINLEILSEDLIYPP